MRCFAPIQAYQTDGGDVHFYDRNGRDRPLKLRCGQCIGCRVSRSEDWATRCVHESKQYDSSVFLTLTFDDGKCRVPDSIYHYPFQKFMKRLRKSVECVHIDVDGFASGARKFRTVVRPRISYFMCGEYGENFGRPHYHALVFGVDFPDKVLFRQSPELFRSAELERLWPFGFSSIGAVTFESAQYVAGYIVGRKTGKDAEDHYYRLRPATGELVPVEPEYGHMSLRPAIGAGFIEKFTSDVYTQDVCVVNGVKRKPPKFYDKKRLRFLDEHSDRVLWQRQSMALALEEDSTEDRLRVQEQVVLARLAQKRRYLE